MSISTLPLNALLLSDLNVRQTERDADIASLAEDIAARGLKQNLVVVPAHFMTSTVDEKYQGEARWDGKYEVIAGGRRFQAMQLLVADGRLPADHPVPVLVDEREQASETSLSENLHRVAMNPADEFEAFRQITERLGSDEAAVALCARRFGVTVKHVQGRLRLAALVPEILAALREGKIGLDSAKAYAGTADHDLQRRVFEAQAKSTWRPHDPASVRQALRGETWPIDHPLMRFVGLEAYRAAGGRTEVELFMGTEGEERALDLKLLEKLAREQAEPLVSPQAKADGFKSGLLAASGYGPRARLPAAPDGMVKHMYWDKDLTKAQKKKAIAVYAVDGDGLGLTQIATFKPEPAAKNAEPERDWEAEREAARRERAIELRAARMAVGPFKGTPLEGRAFWPLTNWFNPVECKEDHAMVAVLIRVPLDLVEKNRAVAEAELDAEAEADSLSSEESIDDQDYGEDEGSESEFEEEFEA